MQISLDSAPKNTLPIEPPTQRALGNFEPRPPQDPEKKEIVEEAKSSLSSIGELAAGEDSDALANALFGKLPEEGSAAAGDVDLVLNTLSDLGTGPGAVEGFQIPEIVVVREDDPANSLPEGTLGAYVAGEDGERGTILISEDLLGPEARPEGEDLESVVLEEVGEAVAEFVSGVLEDVGSELSVAGGDVGDRIQTVVEGGELTDADFVETEIGDDGADEVLVRLNNEEFIAKAAVTASGVTINWKNLTSADSNQVSAIGVGYITDFIWDTATDGGEYTKDAAGTEAWASGIAGALSTLPGTSISAEDLQEVATILDPGAEYKTFTKEDIRNLVDGGGIRFETDASGSVQNASIDISSVSKLPSSTHTFEISSDGVLDTNSPATVSATGAAVSPEQHAGFAADFFDGFMISIDAFNTRTYSADAGSGWEAYATEASTEMLAGANFMNSIFTTMKNVTFNLEAMGTALDANVADGTMTQAEADALGEELEGELLDNFANKYNGELGLLGTGNEVDFNSIEDVFNASLDFMTPGMNSLTGYMNEITEAVPELQDAEKRTELINTIQFVGAIFVGVGVGIGGYLGAGKQLLGAGSREATGGLTPVNYIENGVSVLVGAGVNMGTVGAFGIDDTAEYATSNGLSGLEAGLNETWQDLVDRAGSGSAFEGASLGYVDAYRTYSDMIVDNWPDGYSLAGEQAFNTTTGTELFRTFEGGLNDEGSFGEVQGMIDALKERAGEINEAAAAAGQSIRYEVIHTPAVNPTDFITGDPGDASSPYFEEGSFVTVRVMRDPVVEAGGTPDALYDFDVSMNIDDY